MERENVTLKIGYWRDDDGAYRAAWAVSLDGQHELVLTTREHAGLPDDALLAEALAEWERVS